jgi:hypothetical protein
MSPAGCDGYRRKRTGPADALHSDRRQAVGACTVAELAAVVFAPGEHASVVEQGERIAIAGCDLCNVFEQASAGLGTDSWLPHGPKSSSEQQACDRE